MAQALRSTSDPLLANDVLKAEDRRIHSNRE